MRLPFIRMSGRTSSSTQNGNLLIAKIERSDGHGFFGFGIQILEVGGSLGPTVDAEELLHDACVVAQIFL
jgi:hypothetical protein